MYFSVVRIIDTFKYSGLTDNNSFYSRWHYVLCWDEPRSDYEYTEYP